MPRIITNPVSESSNPAWVRLSTALHRDLGLLFQIWPREDAERHWEESAKAELGGRVDGEDRSRLLEPEAIVDRDGNRLLLVPLNCVGASGHVAVALLTDEDQELSCRLAKMALQNLQLESRLEALQQENEGLIRQVTDDLEELNFLRQIAEHLKLSDAASGIAQLAQSVQELLNLAIQAEAIFFFENRQEGASKTSGNAGKTNSGLELVCQTGDTEVTPATAAELVQQYHAAAKRGPVVKNEIQATGELIATDVRNLILLPVANNQAVYGWLLAVNRKDQTHRYFPGEDEVFASQTRSEFGTCEATLLGSAAAILATHVCNVNLFKEKEQLLTKMVRCLVSAIEARDPYTCGHSERVALFGKELAQQLGFEKDDLDRLYLSGLLHDIGKIAISDAILHKSGKLTDDEFAQIRQHPDRGWDILYELDQLHGILPGVLHHHEQFDGKGYPRQLRGEEIPIDGRILAVVDAFDAMTSDRPYRKGMPVQRALEILRNGAGEQWDPRIIEVFVNSIDRILEIKENYCRDAIPVPPIPETLRSSISSE